MALLGFSLVSFGVLYGLFLIALVVVTLYWIRADVRPNKDLLPTKAAMLDFVEVGNWIVAGMTAIGILWAGWAVATGRVGILPGLGKAIDAAARKKHANPYNFINPAATFNSQLQE